MWSLTAWWIVLLYSTSNPILFCILMEFVAGGGGGRESFQIEVIPSGTSAFVDRPKSTLIFLTVGFLF